LQSILLCRCLLKKEQAAASGITAAELWRGADNSDNPAKSDKAVNAFVPGLSIVPIYGSIKPYAKRRFDFEKQANPYTRIN